MATSETLADTVKATISGGNSGASTVTTLQSLLSSAAAQTETKAIPARRNGPSSRTQPAGRTTKPIKGTTAATIGFRKGDVRVLEDATPSLPPKARYALATEVVNSSLKVLADAARSKAPAQSFRRPSSVVNHTTPPRASKTTPVSQRALQVRSGNATPVQRSPAKGTEKPRGRSTCSDSQSCNEGHVAAVAECSMLAFSYLGSVDAKKLGLREPPKLQLENGMMSLCNRLISLGFQSFAAKELHAVKKRLRAALPGVQESNPAKSASAPAQTTGKHETLAELFDIQLDSEKCQEAWPLIASYHLHVLKLISITRNSAATERSLKHLSMESPASVVNLARRWCKSEMQNGKAIKHLESISQLMLQICPSVLESADESARDRSQSPPPLSVFKTQATSLFLRYEAAEFSGQTIDTGKDILEPFSKCLQALIRRMSIGCDAPKVFETCHQEYDRLGIARLSKNEGSAADFSISRILSVLAERASCADHARHLAVLAVEACKTLPPSHARSISALARKVSVALAAKCSDSAGSSLSRDLEIITEGLQDSVTGNVVDYEVLLSELSHALRALCHLQQCEDIEASRAQFAGLAAGFASRYVRKFPGRHVLTAEDIIRAALACKAPNDEALSWVSKDAANVLIQSGVLHTVAEKASSRSMTLAWASFNKAISLGRMLKILTLKAATSDTSRCMNFLMDDETLGPADRGALLERQLKCQIDLAHKSKHQEALQKLIPETLKRLNLAYDPSMYPVRHARIAVLAMRIREQHPMALPPHVLSMFSSTALLDTTDLGKDEGLKAYIPDIQAASRLSRAFANGDPCPQAIRQSLLGWSSITDLVEDAEGLDHVVDNPCALISQLMSLDEYFGILGEDESRVPVLRILVDICRVYNANLEGASSLLRLSRVYILLGYAEKAADCLSTAEKLLSITRSQTLEYLDYHLCHAEYLYAIGNVDEARRTLLDTLHYRRELQPKKLPSSQTTTFRLLHGRGWLLHSQLMLASGNPSEALQAAKRANRVLNSIWSSVERSELQSQTVPSSVKDDEPSMDHLTHKVSKLNLQPDLDPSQRLDKNTDRGAPFWPVLRLFCSTLLHLSDVSAHHGIFFDANYASEQALKIVESVGARRLVQRVRSHRITFLAACERNEDAELLFAQEGDTTSLSVSLATIEQLKAKSVLRARNGEFEQAYFRLEQAEKIAKDMQSERHTSKIEQLSRVYDDSADTAVDTKASGDAKKKTGAQPKPVTKAGARTRTTTSKTTKRAAPVSEASQKSRIDTSDYFALQRLENSLSLEKALTGVAIGRVEPNCKGLVPFPSNTARWRQLEHEIAMQKVTSAIHADFSLNVLPESTLAYPALLAPDRRLSALATLSTTTFCPPIRPASKVVASNRTARNKAAPAMSLEPLLIAASRCLQLDLKESMSLSTAESHKLYCQLSSVSVMLSATSPTHASKILHPVQEAFTAERARMHASERQRVGVLVEKESRGSQDSMAWPGQESSRSEPNLTAQSFQSDYVDILPPLWTTVSLFLDEKCEELYIARYHCSETPFLIRLPFSRQKSEDAEEEIFDFHAGKAELRDIIALSNYSCHNSGDPSTKGAKTKWWSTREALDRRLHELLLNIENLWLGGFKGMLSQQLKDQVRLYQFRKTFEAMLDRHLPSRKAAKRGAKKLELDDHILGLFVRLAKGVDGEEDLDEPLADLLYFVVDIFQFNGERNAYDEIDFDSMGIEVLDALRAYIDAHESEESPEGHLILVLDRRLQAFPWESLPCLDQCSVSRVDSMFTLRERILQMRQAVGDDPSARYTIQRDSGTYILNPSSDLKATEATLGPELARLEHPQWTSIVGRAPSEEEFQTRLSTSSTMLYFGHGAGLQYIRPRAIRRLDRCSEVVWLMGCSSGAVTEYGDLEPFAVPLTYLMAGQARRNLPAQEEEGEDDEGGESDTRKCMAVIGMLWDVTDRDIDRFSLAVGEDWGLFASASASPPPPQPPPSEATRVPAKTPRSKRYKTPAAAAAVPSTPERAAAAPKTPRTRQPAVRTPAARSRSRGPAGMMMNKKQKGIAGEMMSMSLSEAVSRNRDSCYLRYLNGAAAVVYGVPVYLGD
ncbi:Peptidase C50 domain-containing [Lecanosticta acicola]|uniref:separase n=1 Tax=Lecanosticta acicola TaxID=111012 RepID=A0AAI9EA84_9PEZI|nr:Peptidase C50 domain-containing [Lecanosticta acicola]